MSKTEITKPNIQIDLLTPYMKPVTRVKLIIRKIMVKLKKNEELRILFNEDPSIISNWTEARHRTRIPKRNVFIKNFEILDITKEEALSLQMFFAEAPYNKVTCCLTNEILKELWEEVNTAKSIIFLKNLKTQSGLYEKI